MQKDSKIIVAVTSAIAAAALCVLLFLGIHYLFGNPAGWIVSADMKTFTVVTGGDYSAKEVADYMRQMRRDSKEYLQINNRLYCAVGDDSYSIIDDKMRDDGWEYIGHDGNMHTMRCYYKDGKAFWVRVEYDINQVWCLWNVGDTFDYDLAKNGYKNM